jgi:aspartyl-tRNA(Asn)/glutamyl-tRNA(Gln) amidotransferase subunit C
MQLHIVTNKIHNITRILFMALDISDIKRIAHLARLQISEQEATQTLTKLTGILALIEQMQAVDTAGITPMSHSQDVVQRLREDLVTKTNMREAFQANAPKIGNGSDEKAVEGGLYLVPQVIE